ncbi:MAG: tyrosine-type recombinase/integrase [Brevinema sp.]
MDLPSHYILYLFRHTAATTIVEETGDIYLAQKLLGHANIKTTSDHYVIVNPKQTEKASSCLLKKLTS